ncbi:MAG: aminoglycoside phosphotransferase family protein [Acidobacteriota bacterium]|nr:aminoglycoside phosphotransferase family protein [Acidobacteriota bacterium]
MNDERFARLPESFRRNILDLHGANGAEWLNNLPNLIEEIAENWSITVEEFFPNLSYHFVASCVCEDGTKAVLKVGFNEPDSIVFSEAKVLGLLNGNGAVRLLRIDKDRCALLLERLIPGEDLTAICRKNDEQANAISIDVMRKILCAEVKTGEFPDLEKWIGSFRQAEAADFSQNHFRKAQRIFDELIGQSEKRLLHGDLHHQNILSAEREPFLAIDPKGIVGDIGFEIAVFLNNPRSWILSNPNSREILEKRVRQFASSFEIASEDLRKWAYAEAVLSAWWTFEDNGVGWEKWLACADVWEV